MATLSRRKKLDRMHAWIKVCDDELLKIDQEIETLKTKQANIKNYIKELKDDISKQENIYYDPRLTILFNILQIEGLAQIVCEYLGGKYCSTHDWYYYNNFNSYDEKYECFGCSWDKKDYPEEGLGYFLRGNVEMSIKYDLERGAYVGIIYPIHYIDRVMIEQWSYKLAKSPTDPVEKVKVEPVEPTIKVEFDNPNELTKIFNPVIKVNGTRFKTNFKPNVMLTMYLHRFEFDMRRKMPRRQFQLECSDILVGYNRYED